MFGFLSAPLPTLYLADYFSIPRNRLDMVIALGFAFWVFSPIAVPALLLWGIWCGIKYLCSGTRMWIRFLKYKDFDKIETPPNDGAYR